MLKRILHLGTVVLSLSLLSFMSHAQEEALCAEVKIEILQELTLERQGFEALMRITNSLDSFPLENVSVSVHFADANGNPVIATSNTSASDAAFFIRIDDTRDITGLQEGANGLVENGSIAPKQVGELRWLIIPTANAAGQIQDGQLYFVGAQLRYAYGGKEEVVDVAADTIVVKPQPALTLDYFLTKEIVGDNGFTTEIEPPVPYTLGVRINNTGYGAAKAVKIESAQPTIVENELGLAVDFKILASYLGDQPAAQTLLINFGTIGSQAVSVGRWIMETNLAGEFTAFKASFTHADELGGELTSLLQAANTHFLVRDVLVSLPGRDSVRDFLAHNPQGDLFVYESENTGLSHALCNHCAAVESVSASLSGQGATSQLSHGPVAGFSYAKVADPFNGTRVLSRAARADGTVLNPRNAWLSQERAADNINFNHFINVFDSGSPGSYTLHWGGLLVDEPQPPVIQYIVDRITHEGGSTGFLVHATDPNNTVPTLSVNSLPTGASFTLQEPNKGVLQWNPAVGQAGVYTLTFRASDGGLTTERTVTIRVNPAYDTDGDGLDDQWELDTFGNLDQDGTGDADGDGRSDLQEFEEGTDPTVAEVIPGTPQILSPIFDADTLDGAAAPYFPSLSVTNGNHGTGIDDVAVLFEVYADEGLTELMATATVNEGNGTTTVQLGAEHLADGASFADNRLYYWRARARDNTSTSLTSAWVKSRFFINSANDTPSTPTISSPAVEGIVADVSPELSVTNATDIDRDRLYYRFVIYPESDPATPLAEVTNLAPGNNGQTRWRVPKILQEDTRYLWQVMVNDEHGQAVTTDWGSFLVSTANHAPTAPVIDFPALLGEVDELENDNRLTLRVNNARDPERAPLTYRFELDTVNTFDSEQKQVSEAVPEGPLQTGWQATGLAENTAYYWRVRANDGSLDSPWALGEFTVSALNEAPATPTLQNPVSGAVVASLRPLLEINPALDPEGTPVTYRFELYANADLTGLIQEKTTLDTFWALDFDLSDPATYYWRVRAEDAQALASPWSVTGVFTVTLPSVNQPPQLSFVLPETDTTVENNSVLLQWVDSDPDSAASISLFYTTTGTPVLMAENLSEDLDGEGDQYLWDTTGLPAGDYTLSAVIADEQSSVTATLCCVITVPEDASEPDYLPGLYGRYYGYHPPANGGSGLSSVAQVRDYIANNRSPDATFIATELNYAPGENNLGVDSHLIAFLGSDAASLEGNLVTTDDAILHFTGKILLEGGSVRHVLRVRSDDGYSIMINGNVVAEYSGNQAATTRVHGLFSVPETGLHDIDIVYWDSGESYEFEVEITSDSGASHHYLDEQWLSHDPQELPEENNTIGEESVTYTSGLAGTYAGYFRADHDGYNITNVENAIDAVSSNVTTASFIATYLHYGPGEGHLSLSDHLQQFLGIDAASLSGDPADSDNAALRMVGKIDLDSGSYKLRVRADDGYSIRIAGGVAAEYPHNQGATTREHTFSLFNDGLQDIDIIYWDSGSDHEFKVEISSDDGVTYQVLSSDILSTPVYLDNVYAFARGDGAQTIRDTGGEDKVVFAVGIDPEQLWLSRESNDLLISVIGTADNVRIKNWYVDVSRRVELFEAFNGLALPAQNVQGLVDAMSPLTPPPPGQTTLPSGYLDELQSVINSNWN